MSAVTFRSTLKPGQVETPFDLYLFRPLAYVLVRLALPTPLSANTMTLISIACGLAGAVLFRYTDLRTIVIASSLTLLYGVLDCADGQLARARGTSSRLGRILDGMSDYIVGVTSGVTMALHLSETHGREGAYLAVGGLCSILLQGTLFDHFKNRYLTLSGARFREGDDLAETLADLKASAQAPGIGAAIKRTLFRVYATFLRVQGMLGGNKKDERPTSAESARYAKVLAPLARGWAFLGPSTHVLLLGIFACAGHLATYVWIRLTAANAFMVLLYIAQKLAERHVRRAAT